MELVTPIKVTKLLFRIIPALVLLVTAYFSWKMRIRVT